MNKIQKILFLAILLAFPIVIFLFLKVFGKNHYEIPVFYSTGVESTFTECNFNDEQHVIPDFSLSAHTGETVKASNLLGKLTVVDFFFTSCPSICPIMSDELTRVQSAFADEDVFQILSFSVDPENDTIETLREYADRYQVNDNKWKLITGAKKDIYRLARCGFIMPVQDGNGEPLDFIHSDKLVLVDAQKRIRGYFSGTDREDVDRLILEIKILLSEEYN